MMRNSDVRTVGDLRNEFWRIEGDLRRTFEGYPDVTLRREPPIFVFKSELMQKERIKFHTALRYQESVRRFDLLCKAHQVPFDWKTLDRFRAQVCIKSGKSEKEVDGLTIEEFVAAISHNEGRQEIAGNSHSPDGRVRKKRSTEKGEARLKIIAALTMHHQYADGGCLSTEPVSVAGLARSAKVAKATTSDFFNKEFNGHSAYKRLCFADITGLATKMTRLNGDSRLREHFKSADVTILGDQDDQTDEFGGDVARDSHTDDGYARDLSYDEDICDDDGDFGDDY